MSWETCHAVNGTICEVYGVDWEAVCCQGFCRYNVGRLKACIRVYMSAAGHGPAERGAEGHGCVCVGGEWGFSGLVLGGRWGQDEHVAACGSRRPSCVLVLIC